MYRRILVAIDESATSDLALQEAFNLAKDQNAVLQLVHVVDLTPICLTEQTPYPYVECQKAMEERGEELLASHTTTVREAGIEVDSKLITIKQLWVSIYDVIEEQSEQWPADLIVIGTHGRRGISAREAWQRRREVDTDRNKAGSAHPWTETRGIAGGKASVRSELQGRRDARPHSRVTLPFDGCPPLLDPYACARARKH